MTLKTEKATPECRFWGEINALAREAFPPEEYLAPSELVKMSEAGGLDFWALSDEDGFVGFMAVQLYDGLAYLFFLAIDGARRSKGYGGCALETLRALYPGFQQVVDFEMPDESAPNRAQRERRREFYLRHGYRETGLFLSYLGVDYEVFCMDAHFDEARFKAMMSKLKIDGFKPKYRKK